MILGQVSPNGAKSNMAAYQLDVNNMYTTLRAKLVNDTQF